jgi:hypothetical protein
VAGLPPGIEGWQLLWGLGVVNHLARPEQLFDLADRRHSVYAQAMALLGDLRYAVAMGEREQQAARSTFETLVRWLQGEEAQAHDAILSGPLDRLDDGDRIEALLFLLALARHNRLIGSLVVVLDGLEDIEARRGMDDLYVLLSAASKWAALGSPIGLVVGWHRTKTEEKRIKRRCPPLVRLLQDA